MTLCYSIAAKKDYDYMALSTNVSFTSGMRNNCVNITILDDLKLNGPRSFFLELKLTSSHSGIKVSNNMMTIFIIDDEG